MIVSLNPGQKLMKTLQSVLRQEYGNFEEIKEIENLNSYTVVAVNDEIYIEKVK